MFLNPHYVIFLISLIDFLDILISECSLISFIVYVFMRMLKVFQLSAQFTRIDHVFYARQNQNVNKAEDFRSGARGKSLATIDDDLCSLGLSFFQGICDFRDEKMKYHDTSRFKNILFWKTRGFDSKEMHS